MPLPPIGLSFIIPFHEKSNKYTAVDSLVNNHRTFSTLYSSLLMSSKFLSKAAFTASFPSCTVPFEKVTLARSEINGVTLFQFCVAKAVV